MSRQINFLGDRQKQLGKTEIQDRQILRYTGIFLGGCFAVFVVVFGVHLYFGRQLSQIQTAEKVARSKILSNEEIERSLVIFVNKLSSLSKIGQDRQEKNAAITFFSSVFGNSVFIRQIDFEQKEKLLTFKLQSNDIFSLRQVFEVVNSAEVQQRFTSVRPSDLVRTADGKYEMVVAVVTAGNPGAP